MHRSGHLTLKVGACGGCAHEFAQSITSSFNTVRKQVIDEVIAETQKYIKSMATESTLVEDNLKYQSQNEGAERVLFRLFKMPSQKASEHGKARLAYEEMVRRAERRLLQLRSESEKTPADPVQAAEEVAKELFHEVGTVLTSSELVELFEVSGCRALLAPPNCTSLVVNTYRSTDGTCNNLQNPRWGSASTAFRRILPPFYEDGISSIRGALQNYEVVLPVGPFVPPVPSARVVSTSIVRDRPLDETSVSHLVMQFGQFLDHDITRAAGFSVTCSNCDKTDTCLPIRVPVADEQFGTGTQNNGKCLSFVRSIPACTGSTSQFELGGRQQINDITSFIDGSMIYGSETTVANKLREFKGGRLLVGTSTAGTKPSLPLDPSGCPGCFLAGDIRVNEQIGLITMHTIWLREHNRVANSLSSTNPQWSDERLYQEARKIVGAAIQKIVYFEFLPAVMGQDNFNKLIGQYVAYDSLTNPTIPTEFSTAAFRFGHSLVRPSFTLVGRNYVPIANADISLGSAFANPSLYAAANGTDQVLRGLLTSNARRTDEFLVGVLTNELFKTSSAGSGWNVSPGSPGTDLASLNIQRGRDHGLPPYSTVRNYCQKVYGMQNPTFANDLTFVRALQTYGSLETADLWPLGLAETPLPKSLIGPTFSCLFADAFKSLRDGDRFYFENPGVFSASQLSEIKKSSMSRIICDNADDISTIEQNSFLITNNRVSCSQIAVPNLSVWKENLCAFRVRVLARLTNLELTSSSRLSFQTAFLPPSTLTVSASNVDTFTCITSQCPVGDMSSQVYLFSLSTPVIITQNAGLPATTNANIFSWSQSSMISSLGLYTSLLACQSGSGQALTVSIFQFSPLSVTVTGNNACNLESPDCSASIPADQFNSIVNSPGGSKPKEAANQQESVRIKSKSEKELVAELEERLKDLF